MKKHRNKPKINKKRAFKIFDILIDLYRNKLSPFDIATRPQDPQFLPESLPLKSLDHALYLFYVCLYMRGRIKSHQAFNQFKVLYTDFPDFFNPILIQSDPEYYYNELCTQLKKGYLAFSVTDNARFWIENSCELYQYWKGDPRNLFNCLTYKNRETAKGYDLICKNIIRKRIKKNLKTPQLHDHLYENYQIRGFYGFQEKMVSMLSYFYVDAGIISSYLFPSPIDFHVSRILIMQDIINVQGIKNGINSPTVLSAGRKITSEYCSKTNVGAVELADVLWLYSQLMCSNSPDRTRFNKGESKGRSTEITISSTIRWTKSNLDNYFDTCHVCKLKTTCKGYISEMPYYIKGQFKLIDAQIPIQQPLFPLQKRTKKEKIKIHQTISKEKNTFSALLTEPQLFRIDQK